MPHITLTEDQARVLTTSTESVEVRDPQGRILNFLKPLDPTLAATILECKRRLASSEPRIPSAQVQAHLRKLEEIREREGGMDRDRMLDLLRRMQAGEEV
jgi:hypothetical protein